MQARFVVGAGLVFGAMAVIAMVTYFSNQEAYYTVDELMASPAAGGSGVALAAESDAAAPNWSPRVQVRGDVRRESVERGVDGLELRFTLTGREGELPVLYRGLVPDTFDLAEEVTVAGRVGPEGEFEADQLFVQCPSKYEAVPPGQSDLEPGHPEAVTVEDGA
jgi:cytochrome c-type biogenesis protein CcmE